MCGITGIVSSSELLPETTPGLVAEMCAALAHRGPDESCVADLGQAIFGIRRLAVIDLTPGQLPITNEDGSVIVALNGEIYNFKQLRNELVRRGHRFKGDFGVAPWRYHERANGRMETGEGGARGSSDRPWRPLVG